MRKLPQEISENKSQREIVRATWVNAMATVVLAILAILAAILAFL